MAILKGNSYVSGALTVEDNLTAKDILDLSGNFFTYTAGGTVNTIPKFITNNRTLTDSTITDTGALITLGAAATTVSGNLTVTGTSALNNNVTIAADRTLTLTSGTGGLILTSTRTNTAAATITASNLTTSNALSIISGSTSASNRNVVNVSVTGNTVSSNRAAIAATMTGTAANNYGFYANVSGGTSNYSFYGAAGVLHNEGNVTVGGSLTVAGTISSTGSVAINTFYAGPASGDAAPATFRLITNADIPTLTAPKIASGSFIADSNGNELIKFPSAVASAVNELTISNAAAGNAVLLGTSGGDTNIGLTISTKGDGAIIIDTGTGAGQIDLKPGSSNVRIWDDNSSHYYQIVTGDRTANYNLTLPAGNVELVTGTMVPTTRTLTITNGTGITGGSSAVDLSANRSWTIGLTGVALALHNITAVDGLIAKTTASTVAARTITGTANRITVTNGGGAAGNPTIDIASTYVGQNTITTVGALNTGSISSGFGNINNGTSTLTTGNTSITGTMTASGTVQSGGAFNLSTNATIQYNATEASIDFIFN